MEKKHPTTVAGYDGSLNDLAVAVCSMTYDQLAIFLQKMSDDLERQAKADSKRGRKKLAKNLYCSVIALSQAKDKIDEAWRICEPFMKDK